MRLKKFNEFRQINESVADVEQDISEVKEELRDIKNQREELDRDMNHEAGQKGDDWTDADANRYGSEFNDLDEREIKLRKELEKLVSNLSEEEEREVYTENSNDFREIIEEISDPSEFEIKYGDGNVKIEVKIDEDEFEFIIYSTGDLVLKELDMELSLGDIHNDSVTIKNILLKILSLDGEEYTDFIKSFNDGDSIDDDVEAEEEANKEEPARELPSASDDEDLSDEEDEDINDKEEEDQENAE